MNNIFGATSFEVIWDRINVIIAQPLVNIIARVLAAILIITIGIKLVKIICKKYESSKSAARLNKTVRSFLKNVLAI